MKEYNMYSSFRPVIFLHCTTTVYTYNNIIVVCKKIRGNLNVKRLKKTSKRRLYVVFFEYFRINSRKGNTRF